MNFRQLLTVGNNTTNPSSSQLWFHITHTAITLLYVYIGFKIGHTIDVNSVTAPNLLDSFVWFTLVFSGIVTGNKFANVLVNLKHGAKDDNNNESSK